MVMVEQRIPTTEPGSLGDPLSTPPLELARKADELSRARGASGDLNLECRLIAEAEVLGAAGALASIPSAVG